VHPYAAAAVELGGPRGEQISDVLEDGDNAATWSAQDAHLMKLLLVVAA
jgi:hypothetical protein